MSQKNERFINDADRVVNDIKRKTRRRFFAEEKIRIVLAGLRGENSIAELCCREGITQSQYYSWSKKFMEAGNKSLADYTMPDTPPPSIEQGDESRLPIVLILGMHRSGTSITTKIIVSMGYSVGLSEMPAAADNPDGFYENWRLVDCHDNYLTSHHLSWDRPWPIPEGFGKDTDLLNDVLGIIHNEFPVEKPWIIKDPRITLLKDLWISALKEINRPLYIINLLRNPEDVAASIYNRNGIDPQWSMSLYRFYYLESVEFLKYFPSDNILNINFEELVINEDCFIGKISKFLPKTNSSLIEEKFSNKKFLKKERFSIVGRRYDELVDKNINEFNFDHLWAVSSIKENYSLSANHSIDRDRNNKQVKTYLSEIQETFQESLGITQHRITELVNENQNLIDKNANLEKKLKESVDEFGRATINSLPFSARYRQSATAILKTSAKTLLSIFSAKREILDSEAYIEFSKKERTEIAHNLNFDVNQEGQDSIEISIIIPVYNQIDYTLNCLKNLQGHECRWTFEIIIMDDVSSDDTQHLLHNIPGLRYIRNKKNLGFVKNCNAGAAAARGNFLVFLNNDTIVHPGWLTYLRQTFEEHEKVGVAGSKLVYGDGRLQEAGGTIWDDASGWNVGHLEDPNHPDYNYLRDVDYVSGASFMVPHAVFNELGHFDLDYVPAYYEDTSFCFEARKAGYRVIYHPLSKVTHFEGISSGIDLGAGVKKHQVINQQKFREKWADTLKSHLPNATTPDIAQDRFGAGHILIVDACTPAPDQDSGSIDMINLIRLLVQRGYRVHFVPQSNFAYVKNYTSELQAMGVVCVYAPYYTSVDDYLTRTNNDFDLVLLSRVSVTKSEIATIEHHLPNVPRIFYTVDLHYLREMRIAETSGDKSAMNDARRTELTEVSLMKRCDTTVVLSEVEHKLLSRQGINGLEILPLLRDFKLKEFGDFSQRTDVAFVGGYKHKPNVEAVYYLVDEIWPLVSLKREKAGQPPIKLRIAGSNMPNELRQYLKRVPNVETIGYIDDMSSFLNEQRLTIAPLKSGAGLKGKVAESWGYGVPVVGTSIAFEGFPISPKLKRILLKGDTTEELSDHIIKVYDDEKRWQSISKEARGYAEEAFGLKSLSQKIEALIVNTKARADSRFRENGK